MITNKNTMMIEKAVKNAIDCANTANDYVLDTTEQVFDFAFNITNKSMDATSKILKRGFQISASQHEFAFDLLNGLKKKVIKK